MERIETGTDWHGFMNCYFFIIVCLFYGKNTLSRDGKHRSMIFFGQIALSVQSVPSRKNSVTQSSRSNRNFSLLMHARKNLT